MFHTHGGFDPRYDSKNYSDTDKNTADADDLPSYLATPENYCRVHIGPATANGTGEEMRHALVLLCVIFCLSSNVMADNHSYVPDAGFVPDERTAIQIAEAVLTPIYGAEAVKQERPFTASLKDGVWTVVGSLPRGAVGGVAIIEISSKDGRIQRVSHGR
jgi:hypothetical protein